MKITGYSSTLPILYFSTCLIRAGAWNAYLPVLFAMAARHKAASVPR
jgi:hypothetical protein